MNVYNILEKAKNNLESKTRCLFINIVVVQNDLLLYQLQIEKFLEKRRKLKMELELATFKYLFNVLLNWQSIVKKPMERTNGLSKFVDI